MKDEALRPVVLRIEMLHLLLVCGLWFVLLPTQLVEPRALFLGALFMGVNFLLLSCGIHWVLTPFASKGRIRTGIVLLVVKLALFLGLVSTLLFRIQVEPLSFSIGFSTLMVAIVLDRVWACSPVGGVDGASL